MSHQMNFYGLIEEIPLFNRFFEERDLLFIIEPIKSEEELYQNPENTLKDNVLIIYLQEKQNKSKTIIEKSKSNNIYFLDNDRSFIYEFCRPRISTHIKRRLESGRIYFNSRYLDSEAFEFVQMPDEFIKYGKKLIKDFKKEFMMKFDKEYAPYYFTPKAYNWMIDNGLNAKGFGICF